MATKRKLLIKMVRAEGIESALKRSSNNIESNGRRIRQS